MVVDVDVLVVLLDVVEVVVEDADDFKVLSCCACQRCGFVRGG